MLRIFRHYVSGLALRPLPRGSRGHLWRRLSHRALDGPGPGYAPFAARLIEIAGVAITFILYAGDLYQPRQAVRQRELFARLLICLGAAALVIAAVGFAIPVLRLGRSAFLQIFLLTTPGLIGWRAASSAAWSQPADDRAACWYSGPARSAGLIADLEPTSARPFRIIGFLDDDPGRRRTWCRRARAAREDPGPVDSSSRRPGRTSWWSPSSTGEATSRPRPSSSAGCGASGSRTGRPSTRRRPARSWSPTLRPSWLIFSDGFVKTPRTEIIKRLFDISLSLVGARPLACPRW